MGNDHNLNMKSVLMNASGSKYREMTYSCWILDVLNSELRFEFANFQNHISSGVLFKILTICLMI